MWAHPQGFAPRCTQMTAPKKSTVKYTRAGMSHWAEKLSLQGQWNGFRRPIRSHAAALWCIKISSEKDKATPGWMKGTQSITLVLSSVQREVLRQVWEVVRHGFTVSATIREKVGWLGRGDCGYNMGCMLWVTWGVLKSAAACPTPETLIQSVWPGALDSTNAVNLPSEVVDAAAPRTTLWVAQNLAEVLVYGTPNEIGY